MPQAPEDSQPESWHRHFAASANNRAWQLAEDRVDASRDAELLDASHASAHHWQAVGTELQQMRARMLLAQVHALLGLGPTAWVYAQDMQRYFLASTDTPDWELAFVHAIHAHAAAVSGHAQAHVQSYQAAQRALDAIADPQDRSIVDKTFRQVPAPRSHPAPEIPPRMALTVRPIARQDQAQWHPLWAGYNAFYGREGATALSAEITAATWERFFDPDEPVHAFVAEDGGQLIGLVHFLFHRSTTRLNDVCYLQDLFTDPARRSQGVGRQLIHAVYEAARRAGSSRVYWTTQVTNQPGRALYDQVAKHQGFIIYSHEL